MLPTSFTATLEKSPAKGGWTYVIWPKSATFRTIDLVGLDILGHVVGNMTTNVHDERSDLRRSCRTG